MLRTINHSEEIKRAFSGEPCPDIEAVALVSLPWWWEARVVPSADDRFAFLNGLYALPDLRA